MKKKAAPEIPVVDLFAGPGGLSEGFEQFRVGGVSPFKCVLSIEKERNAHRTLLLRSFVRQFETPPPDYYRYLREEIGLEDLYASYPSEHERANQQAIRLSLAHGNRSRIDGLIKEALRGHRRSWVLIGGPPCQAYSLAGRVKIRAEKGAKFEKDKRHFLYKEYLHIVRKFKPPVFVMENVKGLLSSTTKKSSNNNNKKKGQAGETFTRIMRDFESAGYSIHSFVKKGGRANPVPTDYIINAEKHGIPQARHRVILLGLYKKIKRGSSVLPTLDKVSIVSAIGDLPRLRSRITPRSRDTFTAWSSELRRLRSLFSKTGTLVRMKGQRRSLSPLPTGGTFISAKYPSSRRSEWLRRHDSWFVDKKIKGVTLHESRSHMPKDLRRYLFASHYAYLHGVSPKISNFTSWQLPAHQNIESLGDAPFVDRFRVQVRRKPSTTVVSHISKDGHYYIHYDPTQCRSLTVREAARLQTFPDNYQFVGTRTAQYQQVGNAVPPLLARSMARVVFNILRQSGRNKGN